MSSVAHQRLVFYSRNFFSYTTYKNMAFTQYIVVVRSNHEVALFFKCLNYKLEGSRQTNVNLMTCDLSLLTIRIYNALLQCIFSYVIL